MRQNQLFEIRSAAIDKFTCGCCCWPTPTHLVVKCTYISIANANIRVVETARIIISAPPTHLNWAICLLMAARYFNTGWSLHGEINTWLVRTDISRTECRSYLFRLTWPYNGARFVCTYIAFAGGCCLHTIVCLFINMPKICLSNARWCFLD